jgi:integrase
MASIFKRKGPKGSLVWQAQIRKTGFPTQIKTFKRKGDAQKWARKIEREIESGHWKDTHEASKIIFADALGRYIKTITPQKRPKTQDSENLSAKRLIAYFGKYSLLQITPDKVAAYRDKRFSENVSANTIRIELALLSNLFNVAKREWEIGNLDNPVSQIRKPKIPEGRCPILSQEQLQRLLDECQKSTSKMLYPFVLLALHTGCRSLELRKLKWPQVNIEDGYISLIGKETKSHRRRDIPLSGPGKRELLKLKEKAKTTDKHGQPSGLVFPGRNDPKKPLDIHKAFDSAVKRAGLDNLPGSGKLRIHDLRHCCGSALVMGGVDLETIRKLLGHRDISTTQRYLHVVDEHMQSAIDKIGHLGLSNSEKNGDKT